MLSLLNKKWVMAEPCARTVAGLESGLGISPLVAALLANRGVSTAEQGAALVSPDFTRLHDPCLMTGMRTAVERIVAAIEKKELITVYGDYDVDGVTAASFMVHFFRDLGAPLSYYLPNRMEEGYGLNPEALKRIREGGSSLIVTADCGITAVRETELAREMGLDVIITDHHQVGEEGLPNALAVLNPHQEGCGYPFRFLSGVGLVFKLATAVRSELLRRGWDRERLPNLKKHLDLFVLGTIADVAPLVDENHILSYHGLEVMATSSKPGIVALKSVAGVDGSISARSVAFALAPRLNAAGRLGRADTGLHLLTATDLNEARRLARELDDVNQERQEIQKWTQEEADYLLAREIDLSRDRVIVLASENFHPGVIGIVASRFTQIHYRPTVMISLKNGVGKGSARSIPAFNLFKAFQECSAHLIQYGGHAYAAGMNIEKDRIADFRRAINEVGRRILTGDRLIPEVKIDAVLEMPDLTLSNLGEIRALEPFGQGNPTPVFMTRDVGIQDLRCIGKDGKHARFRAVRNGQGQDVIGFGLGEMFQGLDIYRGRFDIVYELQDNEWNGKRTVQLKLIDIRESDGNF